MKRVLKYIFAGQLIRILLMIAMLFGLLLNVPPFTLFDDLLYEQLSRFRSLDSTDQVVVVAIDQPSVDEVGSWPWPRTYLADALAQIFQQKPAAVGLHLFLPAEEWNPALAAIRHLRSETFSGLDEDSLRISKRMTELEETIDGDRQLQMTIDSFDKAVVPFRFLTEPPRNPKPQEALPNGLRWEQLSLDWQQTLASLHNPFRNCLKSSETKGVSSGPLRATASVSQGHIDYELDHFGTIRQLSLLKPFKDTLYPSMAVLLAGFSAADESMIAPGTDSLRLNGSLVQTGDDFTVYRDPVREKMIPRYSFADVLNGRLPKETFSGRVVLVGITDSLDVAGGEIEIADPAPVVSGAAIVASLLSNTLVARPHWAFLLEAAVLLYLGLVLIVIVPRIPVGLGWALQILFTASWVGIVVGLLAFKGVWFQVAPHIIFVVLGMGLISLQRHALNRRGNFEDLKLLGLSYQSQGLLDSAFDKFSQCPVSDPSVKEVLYNLGLDYERKRMFNKAIAVYKHLLTAGKFKDAKSKIEDLQKMDRTVVLGGGAKDSTMILKKGAAAPTLGRYEIVRELGHGAMGTVYLGRDPKINREVAIKTLNLLEIDPAQLPEVKERFFREAEAAGRLNHPHIVTIYDAGEEHDLAYMAMEYLVGGDLSAHCHKDSLLPVSDVVKIIANVADALAYAHDHDVVHRDIKPSNLMILKNGQVKVTDFGIARVVNSSQTQTGTILGTPSYMSPEQVAGERVRGSSDLFSLGVVCYELLSGEKPFVGDSIGALMHSIANAKYTPLKRVNPNLPECCYAVVRKLLKKEVKDRYQSATEVADALRKCIEKVG